MEDKLAALEQGWQLDQRLEADYRHNLAKPAEELAFIKQANTGGEFMMVDDQGTDTEAKKHRLVIQRKTYSIIDRQ